VEVVQYTHQLAYPLDSQGKPFPILQLRISNPADSEHGLDIEGYLDSGAEYSLLNGWMATAMGFDLLSGTERKYGPIVGPTIIGRVHRIRLAHPTVGTFDLDVGFSTQEIHREILGRDFFNLIQIGFRERYLSYYLKTEA
jgi:hypothetical protein